MEWTQCDALDPRTWRVLAVARYTRVRAGSVRRVGFELPMGGRGWGRWCVCGVVGKGGGVEWAGLDVWDAVEAGLCYLDCIYPGTRPRPVLL